MLQKSLVLRVLGEVDRGLVNEINRRLQIALGALSTLRKVAEVTNALNAVLAVDLFLNL